MVNDYYILYLDSRSLWAEVSSMYQGVCGKLSWCKWRRHDDDMTTTCPWHGDSIPTALRRHGDDTATTWRRLGDGIATTWRRHGDDMATTWRRHGDDMATTWRRGQDDNDDGENDDDGDDEDDGDDHETELYRVWCRHRYTYGYGLMMPKRVCHNQISFSYVLSQMGAMLSESGRAKWVCFVCWQHSTWIVFDQWVWGNSSFFLTAHELSCC